MKILVTGASGLIGTALIPALESDGARVLRLKRSAVSSKDSPSWDPPRGQIDLGPAGALDAVVHLAGESVGQRWTAEVKRRLRESRIDATQLLCQALLRLTPPPRTLIIASAIGYYGDRGGEWLEESSAPGHGFLADLTRDWEAASASATRQGMRVVQLRIGIVLSPAGGALAKMLPPFKLGLAGPFGRGDHYWSWITLADVVRAIQHALGNATIVGPVNVVAPNPVSNADFTRRLARVLARPAFIPMPRFMVQLLFGEMGREALLSSARVRPAKLIETEFKFRHPELEPALQDLLRCTARPRL